MIKLLPLIAATLLALTAFASAAEVGFNVSKSTASLMVREKLAAAAEAQSSFWSGKSTLSVIERYREHVAANTKRLSA